MWIEERLGIVYNMQVLKTFSDVVWHGSWSITGDILAVSGADNKVCMQEDPSDSVANETGNVPVVPVEVSTVLCH